MVTHRKIHCVFYSHIWCVHKLAHLANDVASKNLRKCMFVETATHSNLAVAFKVHTKMRYGLTGLLVMPSGLPKLATEFAHVAGPLALGPNPAVSPEMVESSVAIMPNIEGPIEDIFLLVNLNDAAKLAGILQYVDQFKILWDLADLPNKSFEVLSQVLLDNDCLSPERWSGITLYEHPKRHVPDIELRRETWSSLLEANPLVAAA